MQVGLLLTLSCLGCAAPALLEEEIAIAKIFKYLQLPLCDCQVEASQSKQMFWL